MYVHIYCIKIALIYIYICIYTLHITITYRTLYIDMSGFESKATFPFERLYLKGLEPSLQATQFLLNRAETRDFPSIVPCLTW